MWCAAEDVDKALVAQLCETYHLSPIIAEIMARRVGSVERARDWLYPLEAQLSNPFDLPEMERAVERIRLALQRNEPITVYGDYDTDGITATVTMVRGLQALGASCVKPFFPRRDGEGYGLSEAAINRCLGESGHAPKLLITVDCGITSVEEVRLLTDRGIDVIVTDHHTLPPELPEAIARINPKRLPEEHPAADLCGCATAFMVLRALSTVCPEFDPSAYIDLAAVASIADVMDLRGDNRTLVARGLRHLASSRANRGLQALAMFQKLPTEPTAEQVAFGLVPCINAAGRLGGDYLKEAYRLLGFERREAAGHLVEANKRRREIERALHDTILAMQPTQAEGGHVVIVGGEDFDAGVIGIVAARLMERMGVPVAIIRREADGSAHGSMRSCGAWHAVEALDTVKDLLAHYGGHAQAAGFAILPGAYDDFVKRFPLAFASPPTEQPSIYDCDLAYHPITLAFCQELSRLEPFGHANPKPIFRKGFTLLGLRPCGETRVHVLLDLKPDDEGAPLRAIWFNGAERAQHWQVGSRIQAYFTLSIDTFRQPAPRLCIEDASICSCVLEVTHD